MTNNNVKIPMNLQFFAESAEPDGQQTPQAEPDGQQTPQAEPDGQQTPQAEPDGQQTPQAEPQKEPTVQELMVELAKERRLREKANSEAAGYKKQLNAKMSEKERIDAEKAEREAERDEQFQQLMRENKINKVEKGYLALGYTADEASKMAVAEVDEDFDAKLKIQLAVQKRQKKEYEAEFIKSRPQLNAGTGEKQITKERFDAMGLAEKSKLFRENEAEYNRLNSMK